MEKAARGASENAVAFPLSHNPGGDLCSDSQG
jgi:hypothetical protein